MGGPRPARPLDWLRWQWASVAGPAAGTADADAIEAAGDDLLNRYAEPSRRYHTLEHLAEVLQTVRSLSSPDDPGASFGLPTPGAFTAVALAAWFHDAVYDPRSATNESESASLATEVLAGLGVDPDLTDEVARLVRITQSHVVAPNDLNAMVLVDADLAILAARSERYDRYAADVRSEYGHVPDDAYREGRARVLRHFAGLGSIYHCDQMVMRCDDPARRNLARELERLGAGGIEASAGPSDLA